MEGNAYQELTLKKSSKRERKNAHVAFRTTAKQKADAEEGARLLGIPSAPAFLEWVHRLLAQHAQECQREGRPSSTERINATVIGFLEKHKQKLRGPPQEAQD